MVSNRGVELELGWGDVAGDFSYSLNGNMTWLKNELIYLDPSIMAYSVSCITGSDIRLFYEQGRPVWYIGNRTDYNDILMLGSSIPDIVYGMTFNMAYKGFDAVVSGSGIQGNEAVSFLRRPDRPYANTYRSGDGVFDASYFKLRKIQLGYNLPASLLRRVYVSKLRIYVSLDNFFTFTSYPGFDPETASSGRFVSSNFNTGWGSSVDYAVWPSGIDYGAYPIAKSVSLGINMAF